MANPKALKAVAEACRQMEANRCIEDDLTEMFEVYAESVRLEVFGPKRLEQPR
jgi:hypothetical protein